MQSARAIRRPFISRGGFASGRESQSRSICVNIECGLLGGVVRVGTMEEAAWMVTFPDDDVFEMLRAVVKDECDDMPACSLLSDATPARSSSSHTVHRNEC